MIKKINNKGIAVVFLAIGIVVLLAFVGLAVDIGYMYVVKGQLQNAADAAALAGTALLDGTTSTTQTSARNEAIKFAAKNQAASAPVSIANDNSNTLSNSNDITVGNWDSTQNPKYLEGRTPINAMQVRARKTASLFFGKIINWSSMSAAAQATAYYPNTITFPPALPLLSCDCGVTGCGGNQGLCKLVIDPSHPLYLDLENNPPQRLVWSAFETGQAQVGNPTFLAKDPTKPAVDNFLNGTAAMKPPDPCDATKNCTDVKGGVSAENSPGSIGLLKTKFNNFSTWDMGNKDKVKRTWSVAVALVSKSCSPPFQDACNESQGNNPSYRVAGWARIEIIAVCDGKAPSHPLCRGNGIVIDQVQCAYAGPLGDCSDAATALQLKGAPKLVK